MIPIVPSFHSFFNFFHLCCHCMTIVWPLPSFRTYVDDSIFKFSNFHIFKLIFISFIVFIVSFSSFFHLFNSLQKPPPPKAPIPRFIRVYWKKYQHSFPYNMCLRHKSPISAIGRIIKFIAFHEIVIILEDIIFGIFPIDKNRIVAGNGFAAFVKQNIFVVPSIFRTQSSWKLINQGT